MKFTVVVDNNVPPGAKAAFRGEHGLAVLIETGANKILFDTGQSDLVIYNLGLLGVHPRDLDAIVVSHGHYDHTGGLPAVLGLAAGFCAGGALVAWLAGRSGENLNASSSHGA